MMLAKKIGIDLGTSTVLVYVKGEGIVINEPSLVALNRDGNKILAVGRQAFEMVGRTPETINIVRPMREGVIADFVVTEGMLHYFIARVQGRQRIFKPEVMICVPSGVTSVERRAVTEAAISAGAKQAWLIDEPRAQRPRHLRHRRRDHRDGRHLALRDGRRPFNPRWRQPHR